MPDHMLRRIMDAVAGADPYFRQSEDATGTKGTHNNNIYLWGFRLGMRV